MSLLSIAAAHLVHSPVLKQPISGLLSAHVYFRFSALCVCFCDFNTTQLPCCFYPHSMFNMEITSIFHLFS
ncbi:unnamed protein product [Pleuronectes platessa]|uniref:Uncharacterized protein n=1 Tax=Pleuronectes platessa TaxID=8262 RepID=A0A9N7ULS5_PLEPL|nr:unnamed protein product [Pleuronectes platessa]